MSPFSPSVSPCLPVLSVFIYSVLLSIRLSVSLPVRPSFVTLSFCSSLCPFVFQSVRLSIRPTVRPLFRPPSVFLSVLTPVRPFPSAHSSSCLSLCLPVLVSVLPSFCIDACLLLYDSNRPDFPPTYSRGGTGVSVVRMDLSDFLWPFPSLSTSLHFSWFSTPSLFVRTSPAMEFHKSCVN